MEETTQMFNEVLGTFNTAILLWISGFVALVFIGILAYDAYRRRRNRMGRGLRQERSGNPISSSYRSMRSAYRTLFEEWDRRRRRIERERGRRR
jgi:hypothetical protein